MNPSRATAPPTEANPSPIRIIVVGELERVQPQALAFNSPERVKGDWWSQYLDDVTCPKCRAWIEREQRRAVTKLYAEADTLVTPEHRG